MKQIILATLLLTSLHSFGQLDHESSGNTQLDALKNEKNQAILEKKIVALTGGTADDLQLLIYYYSKNPIKREATKKLLLKKYPHSANASTLRITSFLNAKDLHQMEEYLKSMIKEYPNVNLDIEKSLLSSAYAEVPNRDKVIQITNSMEDPTFKLYALASAIEIMANIDNDAALEIADMNLKEVKQMEGRIFLSKPLKMNSKDTYYKFINTYGKSLFKAGRNSEAYKFTVEAYNNVKDKDDVLIENYAYLSSLYGKYEEALPVLARAVEGGKFDEKYVDMLKTSYRKLYPGKDVDSYVAELQEAFIKKTKSRLSKLIINEAAPAFTVTDSNGKAVSLLDFRGKIVVLDFWATWCVPCVESFPAMQTAVNKYATDSHVKFLFIHTWDNVEDPLSDAKKFLQKRNYKFDLYMDKRESGTRRSPAADAFQIDGIPAKFVIDANGRVRYKVSGFEGTNEAATEEIVQMIESVRMS